ncbi:uncharacterized protein LOC128392946 [Panonychus citri]|uniref:Ecdysis triggering hormone n=1 Tax=Panonychus citri TaxID=50023 RepID=A0A3S5HLJ0_PANCT|nr:uncharacterized protein LOC128392946 [Panonychus citri]AZL90163.1 ecdysis triggering hormone [Panonychus citri]
MKFTGNPYLCLLIVVFLVQLINGQFFTKTSKSIPRMGRRSESDPITKSSLLQAIYGQSEGSSGQNLIKDDQEVNQTNNPEYRLTGEQDEEIIKDENDKDEPEYTSIVIRNLKKVLRAYARKHRNDELTI